MKKAIVFGASGLIGSCLLRALLDDPGYGEVISVARKHPGERHPKLTVLTGELETLPALQGALYADDVFITFGTTKKTDPDYRVDHAYPLLAARLTRENGAAAIFIVTAAGANIHSRFLYNKRKGEIERDIAALGFEHTCFFRPSFLTGKRRENRPLERMMIGIWALVNPFLFTENLQRHQSIPAQTVANAMIAAAKKPQGRLVICYKKEMEALGRQPGRHA